jgi:hypothetical protein
LLLEKLINAFLLALDDDIQLGPIIRTTARAPSSVPQQASSRIPQATCSRVNPPKALENPQDPETNPQVPALMEQITLDPESPVVNYYADEVEPIDEAAGEILFSLLIL